MKAVRWLRLTPQQLELIQLQVTCWVYLSVFALLASFLTLGVRVG
jgi:hypothetical protein